MRNSTFRGHAACLGLLMAMPQAAAANQPGSLRDGSGGSAISHTVTAAGRDHAALRATGWRGESSGPVRVIRIAADGAGAAVTGQIPCADVRSSPTTACDFTVIRDGGKSQVAIDLPSGGQRVISFDGIMAIGSDRHDGAPVRTERRGDLNLIAIGDEERYEIPDAVLMGG